MWVVSPQVEWSAGPMQRTRPDRPATRVDLVGVPLPGHGGTTYGPALVAMAA